MPYEPGIIWKFVAFCRAQSNPRPRQPPVSSEYCAVPKFSLAFGQIRARLATPLPGRSQGRASVLEESPDTIGQRAL